MSVKSERSIGHILSDYHVIANESEYPNALTMARLLIDAREAANYVVHSPYGTLLMQSAEDDPAHWTIYPMVQGFLGWTLQTRGGKYAATITGEAKDLADEIKGREILTRVLDFLLASPDIPDIAKYLRESESELRSKLSAPSQWSKG